MSEKESRAIKLANDILDFVNGYGYDSQAFAETICRGHRTLQQSVMRLFIHTIRQLAKTPFDDRNEATVALAKEIAAIADKHPLPFI